MAKNIPINTVNRRLVDQVIRSGTSIGANYREANETETKKDFLYRMRITRKEAKETYYWLQLIIEASPDYESRILPLLQEAQELVKISAAIIQKSK